MSLHGPTPNDAHVARQADVTLPVAPSHDELVRVVAERVERVLAARRRARASPKLDESTTLIGGPSAVLDSLGWVVFVVDLEQELEDRFGPGMELTNALEAKGILDVVTIGSLVTMIEEVQQRGPE